VQHPDGVAEGGGGQQRRGRQVTAATARRPASAAAAGARGSPAGIVLDPGIISPSASVSSAMVEAVPIVLQAPVPQFRHASRARQPSSPSRPVRRSSQSRHSAVAVPIRSPRKTAAGRAPPVTTTVGTSALAAPMIAPGTVLSQLARMTIPSSGLARIISSISIASRFRYSIVVGFIRSSPSEIDPNSAGIPPASRTPRRTAPASSRSGRLHGFSSLAEFAIPITGRPPRRLTSRPAVAKATRCCIATSSSPVNQASLRSRP
jgi:hypothetical protein